MFSLSHSHNLNKNSPNSFNPLFLFFQENFTLNFNRSIKIRNKLFNKFFFPSDSLEILKTIPNIRDSKQFHSLISGDQKVSRETFIMTDSPFEERRNERHIVCDKRQIFEGRANPPSLCNQANYEIVKDAKRLVECGNERPCTLRKSRSSRGSLIKPPFYITRSICDRYGIFLCNTIIFYLFDRKII